MARVLRGDVYWASLAPPVGHEPARRRPVLVISNDIFNERSGTAITMTVTSGRPAVEYPFNVPLRPGLLPKASWVNVWYLRSLATERLAERIGHLDEDEVAEVVEGLLELVG